MTRISMSHKELDRHDVIKRLLRRELNGTEAAKLLCLSVRQVRRLKGKVKIQGARGLIHASCGKSSHNCLPDDERARIEQLLKTKYPDFKPTHASEKLLELHGIDRDPKTIRSIMTNLELWQPHKRRAGEQHRAWRARKDCLGEMIQFDGSYHDWFEGRLRDETGAIIEPCLLAAIDDATGKITKASFGPHEGVFPVFAFWKDYILTNGKPRAIYLDKFSTYKMNQKVAQENHELLTQFQRAMRELGIEPIPANSPQAKGRVERLFGVLQDRLIKEMRLEGISTIEEANHFLEEVFIPWFNERYAVEPRIETNLHCQLTTKEQDELPAIFSRQSERTIQNDFTFSFKNQWYQLLEKQPVTVCRKDRVIVEERLDGSIFIRLRGKHLSYHLLPSRPKKAQPATWVLGPTIDRRTIPRRPPADHPWRRPFLLQTPTQSSLKVAD